MSHSLREVAWMALIRRKLATVLLLTVAMHANGEVLVSRLESGFVSVRYELVDEVSELRFFADSPIIRDNYWRVEPSSLQLQGDRLLASPGTSFKQAIATLVPTDRFIDRVYPSLIVFDDATSLVNIDYIRATGEVDEEPIVVRNAYDPHKQECMRDYSIAANERTDLPVTDGRYVFLGTSFEDCVATMMGSIPRIVVSEETSGELAELISSAFIPLYEQLAERLDTPISPAPTVFVTQMRTGTDDGFQADVGWDSVVSLRFSGSTWDTLDEEKTSRILNLLLHEATHLWIGKMLQIAGQPARAWLHEGAAEYIALRELLRRESISQDAFRASVEDNLAGCIGALGDRWLMTEHAPTGGGLVYDCGVLVQFVYDVVTRAESGGQQDIIELWRELMRSSLDSGASTITAETFLESNSTAHGILSSVLYGPQLEAAKIVEDLQALGIAASLVKETASSTIMGALLPTFFRADCESGPTGWYTMNDHLALDANDTCQSIPAGFVLRHIQDVDILEDPGGAFASVATTCAQGGVVRVSGRTPDEPELTLPCPEPMPAPPHRIVVRELPAL